MSFMNLPSPASRIQVRGILNVLPCCISHVVNIVVCKQGSGSVIAKLY